MGGLISFLTGSAFRMIWGEVSHYFTSKQDHQQEIEKLQIQDQIDAANHSRTLESLRLQSDLGIKQVEAQSEATIQSFDWEAWKNAASNVTAASGIAWVDAWNQSIRPLLATLSIFVVVIEVSMLGGILNDWHRELVGAILGLYVADRSLTKRGK